jgi:class 3 adenylate cyclase
MAAAGIPSPRLDHARTLALMALDMLEAVRSTGPMGGLSFELRIGINSGPVVAGVSADPRDLRTCTGRQPKKPWPAAARRLATRAPTPRGLSSLPVIA